MSNEKKDIPETSFQSGNPSGMDDENDSGLQEQYAVTRRLQAALDAAEAQVAALVEAASAFVEASGHFASGDVSGYDAVSFEDAEALNEAGPRLRNLLSDLTAAARERELRASAASLIDALRKTAEKPDGPDVFDFEEEMDALARALASPPSTTEEPPIFDPHVRSFLRKAMARMPGDGVTLTDDEVRAVVTFTNLRDGISHVPKAPVPTCEHGNPINLPPHYICPGCVAKEE